MQQLHQQYSLRKNHPVETFSILIKIIKDSCILNTDGKATLHTETNESSQS